MLSSALPQAGVIRAGARNTLRWLSGGDGRGRVAIERWCTRSAAWRLELEAPDSGSATWRAPARLDAPPDTSAPHGSGEAAPTALRSAL